LDCSCEIRRDKLSCRSCEKSQGLFVSLVVVDIAKLADEATPTKPH
jgi:hypothetical protein